MNKRVLFLTETLQLGGVEQAFVNLLSLCDPRDFSIDVGLLFADGALLTDLPRHARLLTLPSIVDNLLASSAPGVPARTILRGCSTAWHRARVDVWAHARRLLPHLPGTYDAAIAFHHGIATDYIIDRVAARRRITWYHQGHYDARQRAADRRRFQRVDRIVAVTRGVKSLLASHFPEVATKMAVVDNLIIPERIKSRATPLEFASSRKKGECHIVSVGRLTPDKGFDLAIGAARLLRQEGRFFRWCVIGEGPDRRRLTRLARRAGVEDCFVMPGASRNPLPVVREADIYVQPSYAESSGLAIDEAMVLGVPVVATRTIGACSKVIDKETGVLVPISAVGIRDGIAALLDCADLGHSIRHNLTRRSFGNAEQVFAQFRDVLAA